MGVDISRKEMRQLDQQSDMTIKKIANRLGMSDQTFHDVIKEDKKYQGYRQKWKREMVLTLQDVVKQFVTQTLNPLESKNISESIYAISVLIDKIGILTGDSTKWGSQVNIGDNRSVTIQVSQEAKGILKKVANNVKSSPELEKVINSQ